MNPEEYQWNLQDRPFATVWDRRRGLIDKHCFKERHLPLGDLAIPPAGTVHLWFLDLGRLGSPLLAGSAGNVSGGLNPRQQRTARRFYLRLLLGAYLGVSGKDVSIARLVKGKPVLDPDTHGRPLDFSSAGSNGCCLVGVCGSGQIGVDLEQAGRRAGQPLSLVRRYFSHTERDRFEAMQASEIDRAFLHTWACKEAVVKAAGLGIANQLSRFTVSTDPDRAPGMIDIDGESPGGWWLSMVRPDDGYIGSVALRGANTVGVDVRAWSLNQRLAGPGT